MPDIPPPPAPDTALLLLLAAACLVGGLILLLAGRRWGRVVLALALAGAGALLGPTIGRAAGWVQTGLVAFGAAVVCGLLGFVLARILWAAMLAGVAMILTVFLIALVAAPQIEQPPQLPETQPSDFAGWVEAVHEYTGQWAEAFWKKNTAIISILGLAAVVVPIALCVFLPEPLAILTSSVLGAIGTVTGVFLALWAYRPGLAGVWIEKYPVPLGLIGGLTLAGLGVQTISAIREHRRKKREAEPPPPPGSVPPQTKGS
jgi:hypothetical protein